jgi:hypothetical protein
MKMKFEEFKREIENEFEVQLAREVKNSKKRSLNPAQTNHLKGYVSALGFVVREMKKVGKRGD